MPIRLEPPAVRAKTEFSTSKCNVFPCCSKRMPDETRLVGGDAVLEGVFHERDEHHGRHGHGFVLHPVREADIGEPVQTQLLQVDVLANILHLLRKGDEFVVGIVVHVLRQVDEAFKRCFCFVRVGDEQAVERVERVEKEVRVDLRLV